MTSSRANSRLALGALLGTLAVAIHFWAAAPVTAPAPADPTAFVCTDTASAAALALVVRDARTGAPVPEIQGTATRLPPWRVGATGETSRWTRLGELWVAGIGQHGRFRLAVGAPGYRPWDTAEVFVSPTPCGPHTLRLEVRLVASGRAAT